MLGPMIRRKTRTAAWVVAAVLLFVGMVFAGAGAAVSWRSLQLLQRSNTADGMVVRMLSDGGSSKPVVMYTVDGKQYELIGTIGTTPPAFKVGEKVKVLYRPNDPSYAVIDAFVERWLFPLIFGGIGLVIGSIGLLILLFKFLSLLRPKPPAEDERFTVE